jgi:hypothetical protein
MLHLSFIPAASERLAIMSSHVPDKGDQMVRYYGYDGHISRGERKKQNQDKWIPCILEPEELCKEYRKNWARLIQNTCEADRLSCPSGPNEVAHFFAGGSIAALFVAFFELQKYTL